MTTLPQACARFEAQLPDYLDGTLSAAERAAAARHAAECARCGPLAADLSAIASAAAALPPLRPERDLWAGIAARIEPTVVPLADRRPTTTAATTAAAPAARVTHVAVSRRWLAAAASVLVAVSAGVSWQAARTFGRDDVALPPVAANTPTNTPTPGAATPGAEGPTQRPPGEAETIVAARGPRSAPSAEGPRPTIPTRPPERAGGARLASAGGAAEVTYDAEIAELRRIVGERGEELDSTTVAVLERNLQVIDAAIAESKRALERDPASRFLGDQLTRAYDRKVKLLRTAALLPSRI